MQIPIENIYYLLCYAWNHLAEKEQVIVETDELSTPLDLLVRVLVNGSRALIRRGIHYNYREITDEVAGIKGKLLLSQTVKSNLLSRQRTWCYYDEFSADILANRIWITTLRNILHLPELDKHLREEAGLLLRMLPPVTPLNISSVHFKQVRLHRNNRMYGFVLNVCRLLHEQILPTEVEGTYRFVDFTRDEKKMALLFEAFVRNFYQLEQRTYAVSRERLNWQFRTDDLAAGQYLPKMITDISLENDSEKIIIDTKYYTQTLSTYYDVDKIHSTNLYQLFSYLMNQKDHSEKARRAVGILLYPTVDREYNLEYHYQDHPIRIQTVNLNTHWSHIATRLKEIIQV